MAVANSYEVRNDAVVGQAKIELIISRLNDIVDAFSTLINNINYIKELEGKSAQSKENLIINEQGNVTENEKEYRTYNIVVPQYTITNLEDITDYARVKRRIVNNLIKDLNETKTKFIHLETIADAIEKLTKETIVELSSDAIAMIPFTDAMEKGAEDGVSAITGDNPTGITEENFEKYYKDATLRLRKGEGVEEGAYCIEKWDGEKWVGMKWIPKEIAEQLVVNVNEMQNQIAQQNEQQEKPVETDSEEDISLDEATTELKDKIDATKDGVKESPTALSDTDGQVEWEKRVALIDDLEVALKKANIKKSSAINSMKSFEFDDEGNCIINYDSNKRELNDNMIQRKIHKDGSYINYFNREYGKIMTRHDNEGGRTEAYRLEDGSVELHYYKKGATNPTIANTFSNWNGFDF